MLGGQLDISARAALEPESTREWLLELLISLAFTGDAIGDSRALELYAKLATTPRDRYRTLTELARDNADPITRMRIGSLFEELRAAVLAGEPALTDPTSTRAGSPPIAGGSHPTPWIANRSPRR